MADWKTGPRVVIVGGGFGGLYCARALARKPARITLVDRKNHHVFQPLLYQVATGSLSPGEVSAPLRSIFSRQKNTQVLLGEVSDLDAGARKVILRDGAAFDYDSLIVATGSQSFYFGHDQWREWAPSLKSVEEATAIRHKILYAFEAAERSSDAEERRAWLTFVIVGGGATGVELAGALGEISGQTLKHDFRSINPRDARILILDGGPRVLTAFPEDLSAEAEKSLHRLGAGIRTGVMVTEVDANSVTFRSPDGTVERLATKTVLWAGGVHVSGFGRVLAERTGAKTDRGGRLAMNPDLTIPGYPEIYVVGDLAGLAGKDGKQLPGVAQVAMQGGAYAARAIEARLTGHREIAPFHYFDKGDLAVIGRAAAVARIFGFRLHGLIAWLVWLFVHIMYLVQFQNRLLVSPLQI